tara:strand:- start:18162 stop:18764 length:603 start_codon:yes stop_codon:yes gene_type:complete
MNEHNPNNKCGYESIWIALYCKNRDLIDKYDLNNHIDLYRLLRSGNTRFPSLFEEENVATFYERSSTRVKNIFDEFKNERFHADNGAVWKCFWPLVAIYFKIEIILIDQNKQKMESETRSIKHILGTLGMEPEKKITLHLTPGHVEYVPEDNESDLFKKLKYQINNEKLKYDEIVNVDKLNILILNDTSDTCNINDWFEF